MQSKITILGSGGMATACAVLLAEHAGQAVTIWARSAERAEELARDRENRRLLPGVPIPPAIEVTHEIASAAAEAELFVAAIPTKYLRETLGAISSDVPPGLPVVSVAKGLEIGTLMRPSEIITDVLGPRDVAALCGPSHAEEIARRMPASVVAACTNLACAERVQTLFSTDRFRVYTNADILGVELAGAIKNVIGIAAGISDGLGFGDNAKSALVTRGLVEITRFGVAHGAEAATFGGLAGLGDLITTCVSRHGRNRRVGELLGQGEKLGDILRSMAMVAEGVYTSRSAYERARQMDLNMPILL